MSTFLVIDDALIMRMRLKKMIEDVGHQVIGEAPDGKAGVSFYEQKKSDMVTLDISMPELSGIEALKQILAVNDQAKVIIISAVGQKQMIIKALKIGAKDFIIKPFESEKVKETIEKVVMV